jgi:uncharacterized membrane protein YphA (DoxX/SURF4 family)
MSVVGTLARWWQAFWFRPVPVRRLAVFRILVAAYVVQDLLLSHWMLRYATVAEEFYEPIHIIRLHSLPRLGPEVLSVVYIVLIAAALCAMVGLATRLSLTVAAPLYIYWYATYYSYGEVSNSRTAIAVALVVLAIAPAGRAYSLDSVLARRRGKPLAEEEESEIAGWAFQVLTVLLVYMYFFAGLTKLRVTGFDWWYSGAFERGIADEGAAAALWLAEHHLWLVQAMALGALVFELCSPVLLIRGRLRQWYAGVAVLFHLGSLVLLRMDFLGMALICAAVVLNLERIPESLGRWTRSVLVWLHTDGSKCLASRVGNRESGVEKNTIPNSLLPNLKPSQDRTKRKVWAGEEEGPSARAREVEKSS